VGWFIWCLSLVVAWGAALVALTHFVAQPYRRRVWLSLTVLSVALLATSVILLWPWVT
jgi:hypothetical protein